MVSIAVCMIVFPSGMYLYVCGFRGKLLCLRAFTSCWPQYYYMYVHCCTPLCMYMCMHLVRKLLHLRALASVCCDHSLPVKGDRYTSPLVWPLCWACVFEGSYLCTGWRCTHCFGTEYQMIRIVFLGSSARLLCESV